MKKLAYFFWSIVGAIVVTFGMTVYTAVEKRREIKETPITIPTPAIPTSAQ